MANNDLSGLKIETRFTPSPTRRWRPWLWAGLGVTLLAGIVLFFFTRPVAVETATVSLLHPSQTLTLLNASGYVVAQRKAAVAAGLFGESPQTIAESIFSRYQPGNDDATVLVAKVV